MPRLTRQVHFVEQHRAHLASAFFASPFEEAAVISIDGFGDFRMLDTVFSSALHTACPLVLVDLVSKCIEACRRRFACVDHIEYHVNDGRSSDVIEDNSLDFVFSMDSLVHADPVVMRQYPLQPGKKLRDGGVGFTHHSNLGAYRHWLRAKSLTVKCCRGNSRLGNLLIHDCLRDQNRTAAQTQRFLGESKLECVSQETFRWNSSRRPIDALTVFRRK